MRAPSVPALVPVEADPVADEAALARLAAWCERYTPMAAPDPPDGLWLDITGCTAVFASEAELAQDLATRLERNAVPCRLAVAGTTGAAWALAHAGADRTILPSGEEKAALADLPITSLRLDAGTVTGLRRLGLRSGAGSAAHSARADHRRGSAPCRCCGWIRRSARWRRPSIGRVRRSSGMSAWPFAEPIGTPEDLARALAQLAERLCRRLAEQDKGGQRFVARFFRVDDVVPQIAVGTALPVRDAGYLAKLLREKLDTVDPGFGIEVIVLEAETVAPLRAPQTRLLAGAGRMPPTAWPAWSIRWPTAWDRTACRASRRSRAMCRNARCGACRRCRSGSRPGWTIPPRRGRSACCAGRRRSR